MLLWSITCRLENPVNGIRHWFETPETSISVAPVLQNAPFREVPHLSCRRETNCNCWEAMREIQFGIKEIPEGPKTSRFSHCLKLIQHWISKVCDPTLLEVQSWRKLRQNIAVRTAISVTDDEMKIALRPFCCCVLSLLSPQKDGL
jgi:hypothetical protein